jgi:hypothetical protein
MALTPETLAPIAANMRMPAAALIALPTAIEAFARKANMSIEQMLSELQHNAPLRDYLAEICIKTHTAA